jgi:uncharacterized protein with von Willebrand factor type A (vWA) domain
VSDEIKTLLGDGADVAGAVKSFAPPVEESPTVLVTDRWTKRAGQRLADQWAEILGTTDEINGDEETAKFAKMADPLVAADAIETLLSSGPKPAERPQDANRASWWRQLMQSPECSALRARTVASPAIAEIAAAELAKQWASYVAAHPEPTDPDTESAEETVDRMRSTREALKEATDAADVAEAVGAGLGLDKGAGLDTKKLAEYTRKLRGKDSLVAIMRMAGRFIAKAQRLQRQRSDLPGMEITGVELSGDVARILPVESSLIAGAVPELEMLALARLVQRRSLSYKRITRTPVAMGPIVVSVDESGSMHGEKVEAAKGLALAMASIARAQKRPFVLAGYTGSETIRVADSTPDGIVDWCGQFLSGGTNLDMPLESIRPHWPAGDIGKRSDHIIISDAIISAATPKFLDGYKAWAKANGVRTFSLIIGHNKPGPFAAVSDGGCWCIPSLDLDNPAIDVVLSIGPTYSDMRI